MASAGAKSCLAHVQRASRHQRSAFAPLSGAVAGAPAAGCTPKSHRGYHNNTGGIQNIRCTEKHDFWNAGALVALSASAAVAGLSAKSASSCEESSSWKLWGAKAELPMYRMDDVKKHTKPEDGIWVTYKDSVYDITNFIADHPGGDRIMLAAGGAIDPFWRVYQMHVTRGNALKMLEPMKIGRLDPKDVHKEPDTSEDDPYRKDPKGRHPALIFHSNKPCNAELPANLILDHWVTPNDLFFIRHHHPVPHIDVTKYKLEVQGLGSKALTLDMEDIKKRFSPHEITCTIQCGGNRRGEFNKLGETSGITWGCGAVSTAKFKGALLRDVLTYSGLMTPQSAERDGVKHVIFEAIDGLQASIPIEKALSPYGDVLVAYEMNDEPLPAEHGFPLRLVVPGHVGVRNVKWVSRITTSDIEAQGTWQRGIAYKGLSPSVKSVKEVSPAQLEQAASVQEQPVQSMIIEPREGTITELDDVVVKGFAWSGGGRGIVRVDVTLDGGKTWHDAELKDGYDQPPSRAWAWTFWEATIPKPENLPDGAKIEICAKAIDSAYNQQPESLSTIWNIRGINNNCWPRVSIQHKD